MSQPYPQRRPLLFVGLLLLLILGTSLITNAMNAIWRPQSIVFSFLGYGVLGLVAVFLLSRFRWHRLVGLRSPHYSLAFLCLLAPCYVLYTDADSVTRYWNYLPGHNNALLFAIFALLVGFVEETYFRGMILRALLAKGPWLAAIVSSVLFGGLHLLHLIEGQNLVATLTQAAWATALGFLFAAVALRTQSILPLIVIHGLTDSIAFVALNGAKVAYTPSFGDIKETVVEAFVYIALGIVAMRGIHATDLESDTGNERDRALVEL
jgi:CAAX protease family protein